MRSYLLFMSLMLVAFGCKESGQKRTAAMSDFDSSRNSADAVGKKAIGSSGSSSEDESKFEEVLTDDGFDGDEEHARKRKTNKQRQGDDSEVLDLEEEAENIGDEAQGEIDPTSSAGTIDEDDEQGNDPIDDMNPDMPNPDMDDPEECADPSISLHNSKKKKFKRGKRKHGRQFVNRVLRQFDDDGDKKLDRRELSGVLMFVKTVVFDGFFDQKDSEKPSHKKHPVPPSFHKLLACFDKDGDEMLSKSEWNLQKNPKKFRDCFGEKAPQRPKPRCGKYDDHSGSNPHKDGMNPKKPKKKAHKGSPAQTK